MRHRETKIILSAALGAIALVVLLTTAAQAASPVDPTADLAGGAPFSIWKTVLLVLLLMVVGASGNWLAGDVTMLQKQMLKWQALMLGAALLSLIVVLAVPWIIVGALLSLIIIGGLLGWYASWRNPQQIGRAHV